MGKREREGMKGERGEGGINIVMLCTNGTYILPKEQDKHITQGKPLTRLYKIVYDILRIETLTLANYSR